MYIAVPQTDLSFLARSCTCLTRRYANGCCTIFIGFLIILQDWFVDQVNFKQTQTSQYDTLNQQQQKLLSRQDHIMYVRKLEELVREGGHDLSALQTDGKYIKSSQHA